MKLLDKEYDFEVVGIGQWQNSENFNLIPRSHTLRGDHCKTSSDIHMLYNTNVYTHTQINK